MLFQTPQFLAFLLLVLVLFYAVPFRLGRFVLLAASYSFYMFWNAKFVLLLLLLTVVDFCAALWMSRNRRVFLITGASIGVVGTLTGLFVGMLICLNIESIRQFLSWLTSTELFSPELYFLSKLPAEIDFGETSAVVIMALTLSFLATLYPSWRAARLDPVEALRYE